MYIAYRSFHIFSFFLWGGDHLSLAVANVCVAWARLETERNGLHLSSLSSCVCAYVNTGAPMHSDITGYVYTQLCCIYLVNASQKKMGKVPKHCRFSENVIISCCLCYGN